MPGLRRAHIKNFFLNYQETISNDFVLRNGRPELLSTDIADWTITFVQTGIESPIGERLRRVRDHLDGDEMFLANYADVLTDAPLPDMIERFSNTDAGASMMVVPPQSSFHCVEMDEGGMVGSITAVSEMPLWENGGYFVLRQEVFDHIPENGDLVADGCGELAKRGRLLAYPYRGFWKPTDTVKERAALDDAYTHGRRPVGALGAARREHRVIGLRPGRLGGVVALGAHCDDIAIGAGGTLLTLCADRPGLRVDALVLSGGGTRPRGRGAGRAGGVLPRRASSTSPSSSSRTAGSRRTGKRPRTRSRSCGGGPTRTSSWRRAPTTRTRTTAAWRSWCRPRSATTSRSATRSSSGTATSAAPSVVPAARRRRRRREGAAAAGRTTPRSGTVPGTTGRPSSAWPGSAASNAAREVRRSVLRQETHSRL